MKILSNKQINELAYKFHKGTITPEEKRQLYDWYDAKNDVELEWPERDTTEEELKYRLLSGIKNQTHPVRSRKFIWLSTAAAILLLISCLSILYFNKQTTNYQNTTALQPSSDKSVILTLSNGKKIVLNNLDSRTFSDEHGISIKKNSDGQLIYSVSSSKDISNDQDSSLTNTIETPKGGQYQVILPDQTKIWLNASSSLKFPLRFKKVNRTVFLSGEGYFEVTKMKNAPFKVISSTQTVEVLGTHFNVSTYHDDATAKVTLLEGRIRVINKNNIRKTLFPGEQANISGTKIYIEKTDPDMAIAWKNGDFYFDNTPLKEIMRQLSRWYQIDEVIYKDNTADIKLGGSVSRKKSFQDVLKLLEVTELVHFKIEGRRVTVTQ